MYEKTVVEGMNDLPVAEENQQKTDFGWFFENEGVKFAKIFGELDQIIFRAQIKDNPKKISNHWHHFGKPIKLTPKS